MSGSMGGYPRRARGSRIPRLTGVAIVVVVAAGGLTAYLASHHAPAPRAARHHAALSSKVLKAESVGVIDFGPDDDGDAFQHDADDHPLMLQPTRSGLYFVTISRSELSHGNPLWTVNQMGDHSVIFVYAPSGRCLTAARSSHLVRLERCNLKPSQRWRATNPLTELGQAFAAYASELTGDCLTAPQPPTEKEPANPGRALLTPCGPVRDKRQEIAFWWDA
jgi:hypothetical protein